MRNNSLLVLATLLALAACGDSKPDQPPAPSELPTASKTTPRAASAPSPAPTPLAVVPPKAVVAPYSDDLAEALITELLACEVAIVGCDATDKLAAFGPKATAKLVAKAATANLDRKAASDLLKYITVLEKAADPGAAPLLLAVAKPQRGRPINSMLITAMNLGDEAFYATLLAQVDASPLRSPFALQAIEYAGSLCLVRPEIADVLFHWAAEHAGNGSASHASVVQGCVKQLDDGRAAKPLIHAALEATTDKAARLELATAAFSVGDLDKASVWIALASDTAVRGSACRELVANAAHIPPSLKAGAARVLERHKTLLQELRISVEDYEVAIALLRDE